MGPQRGRNRAGIRGLVDLPGLGAGVQFRADLGRWKQRLEGTERERRGRGGGRFRTVRWMTSAGTGWGAGELQESGWPAPASWEGQHGTITIDVMSGRSIVYPVMVGAVDIDFNVEKDQFPKITFAWSITGTPTYLGWPGVQPAATEPAKSDQEQYVGSSKAIDPSGLQSGAVVAIDWWGTVADTHAGEQSKLEAVIAAAAIAAKPLTVPHDAKLRVAGFSRDAIDGGTIQLTYGLTSTAEDVENAGTFHKVDPNGLGSSAQVTLLDATPATPAGLVNRGVTTRELNDSHNALTLEAGRRSTVDDHEMDASHRLDDPLDLESDAADTIVYETAVGIPATPALPLPELQLVSKRTQEIDRVASRATFGWGILNSEQKQTFPRIKTTDDAQQLEDEAIRAEIWNTTSGAPALPSDAPAVNVKLVTFTDVPLTPATATIPAKFIRVWVYGPRNSRDKAVLPHVETVADLSFLEATAVRAGLDGETIPEPGGDYVLRLTKTFPITEGLAVNRTLTVKVYGLRTTQDDVEMPGTVATADPLKLESEAKDAAVYTTAGGPPANPARPLPELQVVASETEELNQIKSVKRTQFGILNSEQKRTYPRIETTDDAHQLEDAAVRAQLWDTIAPALPADPPTHNVKLVSLTDHPVAPATAGIDGVPAKFIRIWVYGPRNSRDKVVLPHVETVADAKGLQATAVRAGLDGEIITDPAGYVLRLTKTLPITEGLGVNRTLTVKVYGLRDTEDDVEMPATVLTLDGLGIDTRGQIATVYTTAAGPPSPPALIDANGQLVATEQEQLNQTKSVQRSRYEVLNSAQKRTFPKIETHDDPQNLADTAVRAEIWEFDEFVPPPALPSDAPANNVKLIGMTDVPLAPDNGMAAKFMRVWLYGPRSSRDELVLPNHETNADATNIGSDAVRAGLDGEAIIDPAGYVLRETITRPITVGLGINRTLTIKRYGLRTQAEDVTLPNTWAKLDPLAIDSAGKDTDVYTTAGGVPAAPAAPSAELQLVGTKVHQVNSIVSQREVEFDVLNSEQKRGFPRHVTQDDSHNLADEAVRYKFFTFGGVAPAAPDDPPTHNVKLVHTEDLRVTPGKSMRVFVYGPRSSRDQAVLPHVETVADGASLEATAVRAGLDGETITDPAGYVLRTSKTLPVTDGLAINRTLTVKIYGLRTTAQDITMPGTFASLDPLGIDSTGRDTAIYTTAGGVPAAPAAPSAELQLIETKIHQVNSIVSQREVAFDVLNSEQKRTYPRIRTDDDAHNIEDEAVRAQFWTVGGIAPATPADAPANNVKLIGLTDVPVTPTRNMRVWLYGPRSSRDKAVLPHVETNADPNGLQSTAIRAGLDGEVITDPIGYVHRETITRELTVGLGINRTLTIKRYGVRSTVDDVQMDGSSVTDDASDIADAQIIVLVTASATPAPPTAPSGLKLRESHTKQLTDGKWRHEFRYGRTSREDDVEFEGTFTDLDPDALESDGAIAVINGSATPPTAPAAPAADTKLISTRTKQLHNAVIPGLPDVPAPKFVHIFRYGPKTTAEAITWDGSSEMAEAGQLTRRSINVEVTSSSAPGAGSNPDATHLSLYAVTTKRLSDTQFVHVFDWRPLTSTEEMDAEHSLTTVDPGTVPLGTKQSECVISAAATAPTAPAVTGLVCFQQETRRVGKAKYRHVYHYRYRDTAAELVADKTKTTIDPQELEDEAVTALVWEVAAGVPLDPTAPTAPTGLKLVDKTDIETTNPAYRVRIYRWGKLTSADRIIFPASTGQADPFGDARDSAELVVSTDTIAALLAAERTAMQADITWGGSKIRRLNDGRILRVRTVRGDEYGIRARFWESIESVRSRSGLVQVSQAIARGAGSTDCFINSQVAVRIRGEIIIYRHMLGTTLFDVEQFGLIGDANNAPFLGHAAGKIKYLGPKDVVGHVRNATSRVWDVAYGFAYDSLEHVEDHMVQLGWTWVAATVSKGYASPGTFGWAIDYPPQSDFSVFVPPVTP